METFIVRLWTPRDLRELEQEHVCGVVEQVSGERRATFANPDELIAFLREAAAARKSVHGTVPVSPDSGS